MMLTRPKVGGGYELTCAGAWGFCAGNVATCLMAVWGCALVVDSDLPSILRVVIVVVGGLFAVACGLVALLAAAAALEDGTDGR